MTDQDKLYTVVDVLLDTAALASKVIEDGTVSISDVPALTKLLPELLPALADLKSVPGAVRSMVPADGEALIAHIVAKLALSNAKATQVADAALEVGAKLLALFEAVKA